MISSEIKKDAKVRITGKYFYLVIINIFYTLISLAISYLPTLAADNSENTILKLISLIVYIIFYVILIPLNFGVIASTIKIVRGEDVGYTEFINIGLKNLGKVWKLAFRTLLKLIIPIIILIISLILISYGIVNSLASAFGSESIASSNPSMHILFGFVLYVIGFIYLIIKAFSYALSQFLLFDKPYQKSSEILDESASLMKGNKWNYFKLLLSFIGWYILIFFTIYISSHILPSNIVYIIQLALSVLLTPYISASQVVFYEDLKSESVSQPIENTDSNIEE